MFDFYILITAIVLLSLDYIYLNLMSSYFQNQVKRVQKTPLKMNFVGVALCYILLIIGLYYFIIKPNKIVYDAFLLGLVIYAVYEFTNMALFKNWYTLTAIIDTAWGAILFALVTGITYKLKKAL